ncbi:MAG: hypothetical protein RIK87_18260 [Fuerstiella sp.]
MKSRSGHRVSPDPIPLQPPRRGVVTVMVLIVLLLMSGLIAEFIRRAISDRRQMRQEQQHCQTVQLARAGVTRLFLKRREDSAWAGDSWQIPAGTIHQSHSGLVETSVRDRTATITATYPANAEIPFRVTRILRLSK